MLVLLWTLVQSASAFAFCRCSHGAIQEGDATACCCTTEAPKPADGTAGGCCGSGSAEGTLPLAASQDAAGGRCSGAAGENSASSCSGPLSLEARSACCAGTVPDVPSASAPGALEQIQLAGQFALAIAVGLADDLPEPTLCLERERGPDLLRIAEVPLYLRVSHLLI